MSEFPDEILQQVLDLEMGDNDADAPTVRAYLTKLLTTVWEEEEGFDGKRPFGNSSWQDEVYDVLIEHGLAPPREFRWNNQPDPVERLVLAAIEFMGRS